MNDKPEYVVGFMFDNDGRNVLLIRKNRPEWQAGRCNGVGGKIEDGEEPREAMSREFDEEAGIWWRPSLWVKFARLESDHDTVMHFFAIKTHYSNFTSAKQKTDEKLEVWPTGHICVGQRQGQLIDNMPYLIALGWYAVDHQDIHAKLIEGARR